MRVKLDENLGEISKGVLTTAGHSVCTVAEQGLSGTSDDNLYEACRVEGRVLVTLDRDFDEVLRFPPGNTPGIVILNCRGRVSPAFIRARIEDLVALRKLEPVDGRLWIVEAGRVRIHERREPD